MCCENKLRPSILDHQDSVTHLNWKNSTDHLWRRQTHGVPSPLRNSRKSSPEDGQKLEPGRTIIPLCSDRAADQYFSRVRTRNYYFPAGGRQARMMTVVVFFFINNQDTIAVRGKFILLFLFGKLNRRRSFIACRLGVNGQSVFPIDWATAAPAGQKKRGKRPTKYRNRKLIDRAARSQPDRGTQRVLTGHHFEDSVRDRFFIMTRHPATFGFVLCTYDSRKKAPDPGKLPLRFGRTAVAQQGEVQPSGGSRQSN